MRSGRWNWLAMDIIGGLCVIGGIGLAISGERAGIWLIVYGAILAIASVWVYRVHNRIPDESEPVQSGSGEQGADGSHAS